MSGNNKDTNAMILTAMDELGPADARTIAEHAGVGYSTAVRKLREWSASEEIIKIERGTEPAHYSLRPTDGPLPAHLLRGFQAEPAPTNAEHRPDADASVEPANAEPIAGDAIEEDGAASPVTPGPIDEDTEGPNTEGNTSDSVSGAEGQHKHAHERDNVAIEEDADGGPQHSAETPDGDGPDEMLAQAPDSGDTETDKSDRRSDDSGALDDDRAGGNDLQADDSVRRPKDYFRTEGLAILRGRPELAYTVGELAKLIVAKEIAAGAPASTKASSGAIANAMHKAAVAGECLVACEKPVKFQAA